jgi:hypothetical protein
VRPSTIAALATVKEAGNVHRMLFRAVGITYLVLRRTYTTTPLIPAPTIKGSRLAPLPTYNRENNRSRQVRCCTRKKIVSLESERGKIHQGQCGRGFLFDTVAHTRRTSKASDTFSWGSVTNFGISASCLREGSPNSRGPSRAASESRGRPN